MSDSQIEKDREQLPAKQKVVCVTNSGFNNRSSVADGITTRRASQVGESTTQR